MSTKVKMNGKLISQLNKDELKKYYVGQGVSRKGLSGKEKAILFGSQARLREIQKVHNYIKKKRPMLHAQLMAEYGQTDKKDAA